MNAVSFAQNLWNDYCFIVLFTAGVYFIGCRMSRRRFFIVKTVSCIVALLLLSWGLNSLEKYFDGEYFVLLGGGKFVLQYLAVVGCVMLCFDCGVMAASFCSTIGYCIQHISLRMTFVTMRFMTEKPFPLRFSLHLALFVLICCIIYFLSVRRQRPAYREIRIDSPMQLIATVVMLLATIFIEIQFFAPGASPGGFIVFEYLMSSLCAAMIIILEINVLSKKRMADDFKNLQKLLGDEREKYEQEKANVDMINMKCHDIRHQLRAMEGKIDAEALRELSDTINVYNTQIKTGNEAIDVVLATQGLYCLKHNIKLTCLIDGTKLNFMPAHELYAFFGNAVENAVHAVEKLPPEKRVISIAENGSGQFVNISITNYFDEKLTFEDGLPVSRRENHGFGTRSMRMVAAKYGGRLTVKTKDDLFVLNVFFPLTPQENVASARNKRQVSPK